MTPLQVEQWAELTGEPPLTYGVSPIGTGVGPIMGPGRRAGPSRARPVGRLATVRADVRGETAVPARGRPRAPLEGIAVGPGIPRGEALARFGAYAGLQLLGVGAAAWWPTFDWHILLPGLKHLGPFLRRWFTPAGWLPAVGPTPFFWPAWPTPPLGPIA